MDQVVWKHYGPSSWEGLLVRTKQLGSTTFEAVGKHCRPSSWDAIRTKQMGCTEAKQVGSTTVKVGGKQY